MINIPFWAFFLLSAIQVGAAFYIGKLHEKSKCPYVQMATDEFWREWQTPKPEEQD